MRRFRRSTGASMRYQASSPRAKAPYAQASSQGSGRSDVAKTTTRHTAKPDTSATVRAASVTAAILPASRRGRGGLVQVEPPDERAPVVGDAVDRGARRPTGPVEWSRPRRHLLGGPGGGRGAGGGEEELEHQ